MMNMIRFGLLCACMTHAVCENGQPNVTPTTVALTIEEVGCALRVYSTDKAQGKDDVSAIADAALTCHIAQDVASNLILQHHAAMMREEGGFVDAGLPPVDLDAGFLRERK